MALDSIRSMYIHCRDDPPRYCDSKLRTDSDLAYKWWRTLEADFWVCPFQQFLKLLTLGHGFWSEPVPGFCSPKGALFGSILHSTLVFV